MAKLIVAFRNLKKAPQKVCLSSRVSLQTAYPRLKSERSALLACLSTPVQLDWRLGPTRCGLAAQEKREILLGPGVERLSSGS